MDTPKEQPPTEVLEQQSFADTYNGRKKQLKHLLQYALDGLPKAEERVALARTQFQKKYGAIDESDEYFQYKLERWNAQINLFKNLIQLRESQLDLLRIPTEEDINYRRMVSRKLAEIIRRNAPEDIPFRFHGTSLINALAIIDSQMIGSSYEVRGYETSYDSPGHFSVTTPETVEISIQGYTDLTAESCCLPAGCLFVLFPGSQEEAKRNSDMSLPNIDFTSHPKQLFRILCSPEVLPLISKKLQEKEFDPNTAQEFFSFAEKELPTLAKNLDEGAVQLAELIGY